MNGLKKSVVVTLLSATLLWPRPLSAMDIQQFDKMTPQDQRDFVAFLVKEAQKLLIEQGERDLATKVYRLFREIPPGSQRSLGEAQFEKSIASARAFYAQANVASASWGKVESVLFETLIKNDIKPSFAFFHTFPKVTRNRVFFQKPK
jgi:hypothetical protein